MAAGRRPPRRGPERKRRPHLDPAAAGLVIPAPSGAGPTLARRRFEAVAAAGAAEGALPGDEAALLALSGAEVKRIGEIPYGSNAVFLLELDATLPGTAESVRAIYKPMRGERTLWDFPQHTLFLREAGAYQVDAALGLGHVPPTALRDAPFGPGSAQLFVEPASERPAAQAEDELEAQLHDIAALDVLVNNADRKRSHLMLVSDGRLRAIDNALTFLPYPRQRTALIALGGEPLPDATANRVQSLAGDAARLDALRTRLARLLSDVEVEAFVHRVKELADDPTYPVLDDWDGRPFEWW